MLLIILNCVVLEKTYTREGVLTAKILETKYEAKLECLRGEGLQNKKKPLLGGMDVFWNYTLYK